MGRRKKYNTEEEKKAAMKAYRAEYYQKNKKKMDAHMAKYRTEHKDEIAAYKAKYRTEHKDEIAAYKAEYLSSPKGRAHNLVRNYRRLDMDKNRGKCTITPQWVVENVFSGQCCVYCGEMVDSYTTDMKRSDCRANKNTNFK